MDDAARNLSIIIYKLKLHNNTKFVIKHFFFIFFSLNRKVFECNFHGSVKQFVIYNISSRNVFYIIIYNRYDTIYTIYTIASVHESELRAEKYKQVELRAWCILCIIMLFTKRSNR